jgi:glycosyltransferase involved in cell wall biosynthesis
MKLVIQIPCYNEENYLPITLAELPTHIDGIDEIEVLVIDDGSVDNTAQVAKKFGVAKVVRLEINKGLANAFSTGLNAALNMGADIIVNTDADNQYCAKDIEKLVQPILNNQADIVIGARPVGDIKSFSLLKKILQKLGSNVVRLVSGTDVKDAPSGFRAFSKNAALKLNVFDKYSYTMETIIQAKAKDLVIKSVDISVNPMLRKSRLFKNMFVYIKKSLMTIFRMFIVYRPFRFFAICGSVALLLGMLLGCRFLYYFIIGSGKGHVQSLILAAVFLISGIQIGLIAVLADLISINRKLLEDIQTKLRQYDLKNR